MWRAEEELFLFIIAEECVQGLETVVCESIELEARSVLGLTEKALEAASPRERQETPPVRCRPAIILYACVLLIGGEAILSRTVIDSIDIQGTQA